MINIGAWTALGDMPPYFSVNLTDDGSHVEIVIRGEPRLGKDGWTEYGAEASVRIPLDKFSMLHAEMGTKLLRAYLEHR